ncbi:MAG TPA: RluA family pseudouridine synthase [Patescibacteria group bacterium]|nr:RluA family pseudouridine synthase [Patescibacteria group bacterium]
MSGIRTISVSEEDDGQRLDRWLKKRVPELPYALAQKLIRKGAIRVDGKKAQTDSRLLAGQEIRLPPLEDRPERQKTGSGHVARTNDPDYIRKMVIYDDGDVVALNKPGDIASQGGGGVERHIDGLLEHLQDKKGRRPRLIHRLDRETSGVLLCARSSEAVRRLGASFRDRYAQKIYWAVVVPAPDEQEGTINAPLVKATGAQKDRMVVDEEHEDSKIAMTDFMVLERAGKKAAFVAFMPRTGRTHQIRVHAADVLGCPILGDTKYGGSKARLTGLDLSPRLHLHARRLVLRHPLKKEMLDITAPLSPEMAKTLKTLGFDPVLADEITAGYKPFIDRAN